MQQLRLSIVGFGTVGRWLAEAIRRHCSWLETEYGVAVTIVGVANRRDGFIYRDAGFDTTTLLDFASAGRPLGDYPGARWRETALEGLAQTECDVMAEASSTDPREPEARALRQRWNCSRSLGGTVSSAAWNPRSCRALPY
jgi:homoserine dehydrogenase